MPVVRDNGTRIYWPEDPSDPIMTVRDSEGLLRSLGRVDVVFPILHGPYGEDGTVQGMLELAGLPYVGSGVLASALGMDKHYTKTVLSQAGIAVAPWELLTAREWESSPTDVLGRLNTFSFPVFVKPARAGSSVGVTKVQRREDLAEAIQRALREDDRVLVEQALVGREIECAVLSGREGGEPRVSVAGEIVLAGREFYDFDAKYLAAPGVELVCPAELSAAQLAEMQRQAALAFTALGCSGLARVDFFLTASGWVVNEINTMPGFTPISMFPRCWIASGMSYSLLIDELIGLAQLRFTPQ